MNFHGLTSQGVQAGNRTCNSQNEKAMEFFSQLKKYRYQCSELKAGLLAQGASWQ